VTRLLSLLPLLALLAPGCRGPDSEPPRPNVDPETTQAATEEVLAARLTEAAAAFDAGDTGALDECLALGADALTLGSEPSAAAVAALLVEVGHPTAALTFLDEADARFPVSDGHKQLIFPRARALEAQGKPDEAARTFTTALTIPPTSPFEYAGAADLWVAAGDLDQAGLVAEAGLGFFPVDPIMLQAHAEVALRGGRAADALAELDALLGESPDEVGAHILRLEALVVLGRLDEAGVAALEFEKSFGMLSHGTIVLGLVLARQGHLDAAEQTWSRASAAIDQCEVCAGDEAALLIWAREQAAAPRVTPQPR